MSNQPMEPEGISFYSVKTGETHYCKLEPTIAAYINSSDMGINASRGQDYGWRLSPEWVQKVRAFKRDATKVSILTAKNGGQKPSLTQILYFMYGEQLQAFFEVQEENENPYEEAYAKAIARGGITPSEAPAEPELPAALADFRAATDDEDDISDIIDDVMEEDDPVVPDTTIKVEDGKLTHPKSDGKTSTKRS